MSDVLQRIANPKATLTELVGAIKEFESIAKVEKKVRVGFSANITTEQVTPYLKKYGYLHGVRVDVEQGSYDSHLENVQRFADLGLDHVVILGFFDNLVPALESRVQTLTPEFLNDLRIKIQAELRPVLEAGRAVKQITLTKFHLKESVQNSISVIGEFNDVLESEAKCFPNVKLLETAEIAATVGFKAAINARFYYQFKAPYTSAFWDEFSKQLVSQTRAFGSYFYKALVLDCDNTLWGGIIGEDLLSGIKLNPHDYPGSVFWYVQHEVVSLVRSGVLVCLCSKNNPADVEEVLAHHPYSILREEHVVMKKVNWENKVSNLKDIARELNIGLDSLIFVDDSDFEVAAVRSQLPMVKTFQVPKNVFEYPALFREIRDLFIGGGISTDGGEKTKQYKLRSRALDQSAQFENQDDYLRSLELKVSVNKDARSAVKRIAELSQKSNQFNLTTLRLTEAEVLAMMDDPKAAIYSLNVADKFGDHGLTGIVVARHQGDILTVENFLMSCRVIGRGIEYAIWKPIFRDAIEAGCKRIEADFIKSPKNQQVEGFYESLGIKPETKTGERHHYAMAISDLKPIMTDHVEVTYVS